MVTLRNSNKYKNLLANPKVSLLIDSRDHPQSQALTVDGVFEQIMDEDERKWATARLVDGNSSLNEFLCHPDVEVFRIRAKSYLLLNGLSDAYYLEVD